MTVSGEAHLIALFLVVVLCLLALAIRLPSTFCMDLAAVALLAGAAFSKNVFLIVTLFFGVVVALSGRKPNVERRSKRKQYANGKTHQCSWRT